MFRLLWKNKILVVILAALVFLLPQAVSRPAQMLNKTLLTSLGIDRAADAYTLAGEMIVNQSGEDSARKSEIVTAAGATVGEALNNLMSSQGREVSLAHCTLIVLGQGLAAENLTDLLRYFFNKAELNNNCALMYTAQNVPELMETAVRDKDSRGSLLTQISAFAQANLIGHSANLESFFKASARETAAAVIAAADSENDMTAAVFKKGKYHLPLTPESVRMLNFLKSGATQFRLTQGTDIFEILDKTPRLTASFTDGTPAVSIKIQTKLQSENNPDLTAAALTEKKHLLQYDIETGVRASVTQCYQSAADILNLYDLFARRHPRALSQHLETLAAENSADPISAFLKNLDFNIEVDVLIIT